MRQPSEFNPNLNEFNDKAAKLLPEKGATVKVGKLFRRYKPPG